MQWLLLAVTFVIMTLLERLTRGAPIEARATLVLGFLTLAAYIAGTIARRFRLPRIVGFLLAGFVAGPAWLDLAGGAALQSLDPIAHGALALIAFAVGSELTLDALRGERRRAVLGVAAGAIGVPFVLVTLVVLSVSPWFPLTAHQPFGDALAVALVLGTLAAVASPTLTWATITDLEARGPLSRTVLDVTVVQDLAAVVLLSAVLGVALLSASRGAVTPGIAGHTLLLFGGSLAAGVALGFGTAEYLRAIHGRLEWVLVILAFIVAQVVRLAGADPVLLALAAGCTLRNAAPARSERLSAELKRCALPVYVVFFALAGSNLQLDVLAEIWPWALLLVGLRVTGLWSGLRWAGRRGIVSADVARYGWLGLVSQGGLAVTLAALLRRAFPEWNISLEALLVAMIGVHQLAGPICFHWALRRTGELTEEAHAEGTEQGAAILAGGSGV